MTFPTRFSLFPMIRATAVLAGSMLLLASAPAARADSAPPRVAIANTAHIFAEMQETKDLKAKLEAKRQEITTEEQDRRSKLSGMEAGLKEIAPDNPQYKTSRDALDKSVADFEVWGKLTQLQAERDQKDMMVMLFNKIQKAVGQVATQDGIDIVIADQGPDLSNVDALTFDQLRSLINQKDVLFTSKKADISDEVLTLLDAQYAKDKAAGK
jgi:Skp family chaperone for outer membrane proteins